MTIEAIVVLVFTLLLVALALCFTFLLLRLSRPSLRDVFSRDWKLLGRRLLVGLADVGYTIIASSLFFHGEMPLPFAQSVIAFAVLAVFLTGLTLWLLAALQLIGLAFVREKKPAGPPAQSSP